MGTDTGTHRGTSGRLGRAAGVLGRQARAAWTDPGRLRRVLDRRYWRQLRHQVAPPEAGGWTADAEGRQVRRYSSYDAYVEHQRSKLDLLDLSEYDVRYRAALAARLAALDVDLRGAATLCLAARIGTEVKAFGDVGAFAVGIDLNPGEGNRWVLPGDFHDLQFPDGSADVVFTNSLDHALDPERLAAEVRRVLAPGGHVLLELGRSQTDGTDGQWESFIWDRPEVALAPFTALGLVERQRVEVDYPASHDLLVVLQG